MKNLGPKFQGLHNYLVYNYPQLQGRVFGKEFPTSQSNSVFRNVVIAIQIIFLVVLMLGENLLKLLKIPITPDIELFMEYRPMIFGFVFIFTTTLLQFAEIDAFEISVNGVSMFSKIRTGRFPTGQELIQILEAAGIKHQGQIFNM